MYVKSILCVAPPKPLVLLLFVPFVGLAIVSCKGHEPTWS